KNWRATKVTRAINASRRTYSTRDVPSSPCLPPERRMLADAGRTTAGSAADGGAEVAQLRRGAATQEGDRDDADDGDQRHEERVLDEAGPDLGLRVDAGPHIGR